MRESPRRLTRWRQEISQTVKRYVCARQNRLLFPAGLAIGAVGAMPCLPCIVPSAHRRLTRWRCMMTLSTAFSALDTLIPRRCHSARGLRPPPVWRSCSDWRRGGCRFKQLFLPAALAGRRGVASGRLKFIWQRFYFSWRCSGPRSAPRCRITRPALPSGRPSRDLLPADRNRYAFVDIGSGFGGLVLQLAKQRSAQRHRHRHRGGANCRGCTQPLRWRCSRAAGCRYSCAAITINWISVISMWYSPICRQLRCLHCGKKPAPRCSPVVCCSVMSLPFLGFSRKSPTYVVSDGRYSLRMEYMNL